MNFDMNQALGMGVKNDTQKNTIKKLLAFIVATLVVIACVIASVGAIINGVHAVDNWMFGYDTVEVSYAETTHLVVEHHEGAVQKIVRAANNLKVSTGNKVDELLRDCRQG